MSENLTEQSERVKDLLNSGFSLFRTGFGEIAGILLTQTVCMVFLFVMLFSITMSFYDNSSLSRLPTEFVLSMLLSILIMLLVQLGFIASFTTKFWAIAHQQRISAKLAYRHGIKKALPLLIWGVIYLLVVWTGILLFFVPGLILGVSLFMGAALIIQDHVTPFSAFKVSHKMVWPYLRLTLFYLCITIALCLALYFLILYPLGLLVSYLTSTLPMLHGILDIARYALIVILVPLFVALIIPYYMLLLQRSQGI